VLDAFVGKTSALINAGGTPKRKKDLLERGLAPNKLMYYPNRFQSAASVMTYHCKNYDAIKEWLFEGASLPKVDDDDDDDCSQAVLAAREAYESPLSRAILAAANGLFEALPALVKDVSGEHESVPSDIVARLEHLCTVLQHMSIVQNATQVFMFFVFW
jgi:hypothetical protein